MLDFCITDAKHGLNASIGDSIGSDHLPVIIRADSAAPVTIRQPARVTKNVRCKYKDSKDFRNCIHSMCGKYMQEATADRDLWQPFIEEFSSAINSFYPSKKVTFVHKNRVALTSNLIKCIATRTNLYKVARLTQSKYAWDEYYKYKRY